MRSHNYSSGIGALVAGRLTALRLPRIERQGLSRLLAHVLLARWST